MFDAFSKKAELLFKGLNQEKNNFCSFVSESLVLNQDGVLTPYCVFRNSRNLILDDKFNFLWIDTEKVFSQLNNCNISFRQKHPHDNCIDCLASSIHTKKDDKSMAPIKRLYLSHWKCCPFNCLYCEREKKEDISLSKHYDIMPVINQLIDTMLIDKKTQIIFECGDATLHPDFDKLIYFFLDYGMTDIVVHTSALRYCQSVADSIGRNRAKVYIPIDSGSWYQMNKIKQLDKQNIILTNVNRYIQYQDKNAKNITFKYTLIKGTNDYTEGILEFFLFTKNSRINNFYLDIEDKWFYEIRYEPPTYLLDIISFSENLAKMNDFSFEFSDKINYLHSKKEIKKED